MNIHRETSYRRFAQRGVTLIELMVALVLGLLLMAGAVQIFVSNRATYAFNEGFSRLQENGRYALDTLNFNVRMAGHLGCLSTVNVINNLNGPNNVAFNFAEGIRGYEAVGTTPGQTLAPASSDPANSNSAADWAPALPAALVGAAIPGSDVLIVRNVSPIAASLLSPFADATKVYADAVPSDFARGDIGIVSDCQKASVFQITNVVDSSAGGITSIDVSHVAAGAPGNLTTNWDTDQQYSAGAQLMRGETWIYYVGASNGGPPALFQQRLQTDDATTTSALVPEELADSVETMQVRYGVDTNDDGTVDVYQTADAVANWARVVTVRIGLVVRSPDEYGTEVDTKNDYDVNETLFNPVDDRRVRQVFTTTVAIRNRLP
jgi:type IV pilus assembly protein PilW